MRVNPVGWFEIYVNDLERAKTFYEAVFQGKLEQLAAPPGPPMKMLAFPMEMGAGGAAGALVKMDGGPTPGAGTIVYFMCEDCALEAKRAASAGGRIVQDKFSIGQYGFCALVNDTEGNVIGLHSMK